jgi:hypothetical protein
VNIHIPTPTLDKMLANKVESQAIGNFLTWLSENEFVIAKYGTARGQRDTLVPEYKGIKQMLADYFGVDLTVAEKERRAILAGLQAAA